MLNTFGVNKRFEFIGISIYYFDHCRGNKLIEKERMFYYLFEKS